MFNLSIEIEIEIKKVTTSCVIVNFYEWDLGFSFSTTIRQGIWKTGANYLSYVHVGGIWEFLRHDINNAYQK